MCGIVGYTGFRLAVPVLLDALANLEYRGYDSAGIAVVECGKLKIFKKTGKINNLKELLKNKILSSSCGIGHTRWATHGVPEERNAHPHINDDCSFAIVHNGIIENYDLLKKKLNNQFFRSQTDTEVVAHLLNKQLLNKALTETNILKSLKLVCDDLKGSFAFAIVFNKFKDKIFVSKRSSPLIIGVGKNENFIASDIPAILKWTNKVIDLKDNEFGIISAQKVEIFDCNLKIKKFKIREENIKAEQIILNGFDCFMHKEIEQGAEAIQETANKVFNNTLLEQLVNKKQNINKIHICACGTALHAGLIAKFLIEKYCRKDVIIDFASEFRYKNPIINSNSLCLFISQSGETADTIAGLELAKSKGAFCIAITNVLGSRITQIADFVIPTFAGPEIAVASTKAYVAQISALLGFTKFLFKKENIEIDYNLQDIYDICDWWKNTNFDEVILKVVKMIKDLDSVFFIGRSVDYYVAQEAALKLKEITYIHCEAFAGGELKHGSLALINDKSVVIVILTQSEILEKTLNAIHEIKSRGAKIVMFSQFLQLKDFADLFVILPNKNQNLMPLVCAKPLQTLAYLTSKIKGFDPDKPRNLAKSVTVE